MRLWHYTSVVHLQRILEAGVLKTTESNLSPAETHAGPDVVWLLDTPELGRFSHGLGGSFVDKTEVRIEVDVPSSWVRPWRDWAVLQGIDPAWMAGLEKTGGGAEAARHWIVCLRPIPRDRWLRVERRTRRDGWRTVTQSVTRRRPGEPGNRL